MNDDNTPVASPNPAMQLHLQTIPASAGTRWIRHGFQVFRRKPLALTGLFALFILAGSIALLLPFVGVLLLLMSPPLVSLGFMLATHQVLQQKTPTVAVYVAPLKLTAERRRSQLLLCAAYAVSSLLIAQLAHVIDGGAFDELMQLTGQKGSEAKVAELMARPEMFWGAMSRFALMALLAVPFWHAPALVHWGGQGVMQALFSSTLGLWRNKGAFVVNGLAWLGLMLGLGMALSLLTLLLGVPQLVTLLAAPLALMGVTIFYSSLYFSFVDCFMSGTPRELPLSRP